MDSSFLAGYNTYGGPAESRKSGGKVTDKPCLIIVQLFDGDSHIDVQITLVKLHLLSNQQRNRHICGRVKIKQYHRQAADQGAQVI